MEKTVISKWQVTSIDERTTDKVVYLMPVTNGSEENKEFWQATPTGSMNMTITNAHAADMFKRGDEVLVTFRWPE
jgi:hypothetical protein